MTHITALLLWPRPYNLDYADEFLPAQNWTLIIRHPDEDDMWVGLKVDAVLDPWDLVVTSLVRQGGVYEHWAALAACGPVVAGFRECRRWVENR